VFEGETMGIDTIIVGPYEVNCYIISNPETNHALIIDPGLDGDRIKQVLDKRKLIPCSIVNTHGHADHIGANSAFDLPIYIHEADTDFLTDPVKNLSLLHGISLTSPKASRLLHHGDVISLDFIEFEVVHTPGHTPGSICLKTKEAIFTGDTLFRGSIGRTDFPHSDGQQIMHSITTYITPLRDDVAVYPGHGPSSTVGWEKQHNFFISERTP